MIRFLEVKDAIKKIEQDSTRSTTARISSKYQRSMESLRAWLKRVAEIAGLSPREVIDLYSSTTFTIYFLGFLCAQPYLGGLPERLHTPRLDNPRIHMPAGSVGIGGIQASLLTIDQPSGHNFIGRTFLSLYDPARIPPPPLKQGIESFLNRYPKRNMGIKETTGKEGPPAWRGLKT
jgi:KipI family sensor histidine kinase inhibitor